ncbi:MAG: MazG nucleotide pyrophosphohydrolase domain-containing protein [Promethearchaeota archaeon]
MNSITSEVDKFIRSHGGYWEPAWLLAAINEELGELSRALQIYSGIRTTEALEKKTSIIGSIEEECGDIFYALICLANFFNLDLETALYKTLNKYNSRYELK